MKPPSTALLRTFSPIWQSHPIPWTARGCVAEQQKQSFSSTSQRQKRNRGGPKTDPRVLNIRYHLHHPLTPRPLRFSRTRSLRHWTIHRAWQLYQQKLRTARQATLRAQYTSMYKACEALRQIDSRGLNAQDRMKLGEPPGEHESAKDVGRLYRIAMQKKGIWDGVPIEYARLQTESPGKDGGWNYAWTR